MSRLADRASAPAASLSGGERQRMSLARAWVTEPSVIILDEPAASLDPASTKELETLVREISTSGVKVIIATHDLAQARRLADEVLMFGHGKLLAHEPAEYFFSKQHVGEIAKYLEGRL
jgi:tungstate transport system ATP-binding protein